MTLNRPKHEGKEPAGADAPAGPLRRVVAPHAQPEPLQSQVEGSYHRWRGAVSGRGEQSLVEESSLSGGE